VSENKEQKNYKQ